MRFSEAWLRDFVDFPLTTAQLVEQLTMAGLEVDSAVPAAGSFRGVVVAEILETWPHPHADRLQVCRVAAGSADPLQVVCGAPNARVGLRTPLALEGAELPGGVTIQSSELRGVLSQGMLCSAKELGIDDSAAGLLELPEDARVGADLRQVLQLDDWLIELDLTPNRADCLSVEGVAREVALLNQVGWRPIAPEPIPVTHQQTVPVVVEAVAGCPRYLGRLITGVDRTAPTPLWMKERLRRSGLRSVDAVVDVTNYVLLELGQPLHAFDAGSLRGGIRVRMAQSGERLDLLNGQTVLPDTDVLVIADEERVLALAGIMGGSASAVGAQTRDIFLECAFFSPAAIAGRARRYGLNTDSAHRFERGVDPELQARAIERASELILSIAGGSAGPITEAVSAADLPRRDPILLRAARIEKLLGIAIPGDLVTDILSRLQLQPVAAAEGWRVTPPGFRFDLAMEADLIEEIGRVYGYDRLPRRSPTMSTTMRAQSERELSLSRVKDLLVDRGYQEAITYSFVDRAWQERIDPEVSALALKNPISAELAVMRTGLWTGLLDVALKNSYRQHSRIRLFETGLKFSGRIGEIVQRGAVAGLASGAVMPEQWGERSRPVDFFDLKADIEAIVALTGRADALRFTAKVHPALHPGQSAMIQFEGEFLGWLGMLHPKLGQQFGFEQSVFLFELEEAVLLRRAVPRFLGVSRFPQARRDIAIIVDEHVSFAELRAAVQRGAAAILREVILFDIYRGPGVEPGRKSVALGLVWQDDTETLTDARVDEAVAAVVQRLQQEFAARLRD